MKICLAQYNTSWECKEQNMVFCKKFFEEASKNFADLIVFPELSLTGFTMDISLAEAADGETVAFFARCSKQYGLPCVFGYAEKIGEGVYNRLAFADEMGIVSAVYSKIHPFSYGGEDRFYKSGDMLQSFSLGGIEIGLTICYDLRFPELYQQLSKRCDAIIVSANWGGARREHWNALLKARAIENQCYIIGCNRTGEGGGVTYSGDSAVISPFGDVVSQADSEEMLVFVEIDTDAVNEYRSSFPLKQDRRPDIYRNFYE